MTTPANEVLAKARIGRLLEVYCEVRNIHLESLGSWGDESYRVGADRDRSGGDTVPDLVIEVVEASCDLLRKTYRVLEVPEVWLWVDGHFDVFVLAEGFYLKGRESHVLPGLDLALLERCIALPTSLQAVKALRTAIG